MFSVSPAEIVTIAVIALLVFGPHRLPEIARKIGRIGKELSRAANELKSGIEAEYEQATAPLDDVRRQLGSTLTDQPDTPAADDKPTSEGGPQDLTASDEQLDPGDSP